MKNIDQDAVKMTDLEKYVAVGLGGGQWTEVYHWSDHGTSWQSPTDDYVCIHSMAIPVAVSSMSPAISSARGPTKALWTTTKSVSSSNTTVAPRRPTTSLASRVPLRRSQ